ncbi:MAG TPA: phosphotransferase [Phycisphaerae bacterium]|nr:phosphotransferase [Phycisphaerae bacterium]HNU44011.1 phosphotransferase [Phycisphaerae bacterium]
MDCPASATFTAAELAIVLSHYDLGVVQSITGFPRGSRRSPKAGIVAEHGKYLLKRRAEHRADAERARFGHLVQQTLAAVGYPAPQLVPTRSGGDTLLELKGHVYELFKFIAGERYRRSPAQTREAGLALAKFHQLTAAFPGVDFAQRGDYHDATAIRTGLCAIGSTLNSHDSFTGDEAALAALIQDLLTTYDRAADAVNRTAYAAWPLRLIHSDFHPGNLLFRRDKVVAVFDYDSVRLARRVIDVANGALQFSLLAGQDPLLWPDQVDEQRFVAFLNGYCSCLPLEPQEAACVPSLMVEALITECVPPITQTGTVGKWAGFRVLQMVRRKTAWLAEHAERLVGMVPV